MAPGTAVAEWGREAIRTPSGYCSWNSRGKKPSSASRQKVRASGCEYGLRQDQR